MNRTCRILVVEDNPADADLIREMLPHTRPASFQVESAARLAETLTRADLPVILMSGFAPELTPDKLREVAVCELLQKPVSKTALAEAVQRNLAKH
jgi:CheY-like chemotaxis protein